MREQSTAHNTNGIGHFDIAGQDLSILGGFYAAVFGWKIDVKGPGYALSATPDGSANGALVESETSAITIGVIVPELSQAVEAAKRSGGSIVMPTTDNGWVRKAQVA